ncbi:MAG: hypothetical protein HGA30_07260, partial [Anaerolineales bacterium]|nr:hypothetical protein [Anaerolineales bacterium]
RHCRELRACTPALAGGAKGCNYDQKLMCDSDPEESGRVMQAMLKMRKIIVADLQKAYDGK